MPVRRFRSVEEMEESVWMDRDDSRLWSTIASVWALSARLCPAHYPPGVYKHRTIEAMNAQTDAWEVANMSQPAQDGNTPHR